MPHTMPTPEMIEGIKACADCATICAQTAHHCLHLGGEHALPEHQGLLQDCKQICAVAVGFMARASHHSADLCRQCGTICNECADDCDRMAQEDRLMRHCAEVCRRCAQSCEKMAGAMV